MITSPVVPALEVLRPACVEARTNDVDSYVDGVLKLMSDRDYYESLRRACPGQAEQFYDRKRGLTEVLKRIVEPLMQQARPPRNRQAADKGARSHRPGRERHLNDFGRGTGDIPAYPVLGLQRRRVAILLYRGKTA